MPRWKRVCRWMGRSAGEQGQAAVIQCIPNADYLVHVPASRCLQPRCFRLPAAGRSLHTPAAAGRWACLSAPLRRSRTRCLQQGSQRLLNGCQGRQHDSAAMRHQAEPPPAATAGTWPAARPRWVAHHSLPLSSSAHNLSNTPPAAAPHLACRALPLGRPSRCRRCPGRSPSRQRWWPQWGTPGDGWEQRMKTNEQAAV